MQQVASNGTGLLPDVLVEYVPEELRNEISEAFEMEGLMQESAETRIKTAIGEGFKVLHTDLKATDQKVNTLGQEMRDMRRDVNDLLEWKKGVTDDKQATGRTAKDSVIRYTIGSLIAAVFTLLGIVGTVILRPAPAPEKPVQAQQAPERTPTDVRLDKLIELYEKQTREPVPVKKPNKPRQAPEPVRIQQYKNKDFLAPGGNTPIPMFSFSRSPLSPMERPN